jgi:hypothetical protein
MRREPSPLHATLDAEMRREPSPLHAKVLPPAVWNGFQRNKKVLFLLLAILLHGMVDALIPIISSVTTSVFAFYGAFLAVDIIMVIYAFHSRKYYLKEAIQ